MRLGMESFCVFFALFAGMRQDRETQPALTLTETAWRVAEKAELPRHAYALVRRQATAMRDIDPTNGSALCALSAALYRLGRYEEALDALLASDTRIERRSKEEAVFLALTHHRLENAQEAGVACGRAKGPDGDFKWPGNAEGLLRELEIELGQK